MGEATERAEGWYRDPWQSHERRWFSNGFPTHLVADGNVEAKDPPPAASWDGPLEFWWAEGSNRGEDLRRADASGDFGDHEWETFVPDFSD
jgi:hypothetical protein